MPIAPQTTFSFGNNLQARYPGDVRTVSCRLPGGVSYPRGQVLAEVKTTRVSEVQTVTITATGGTMRVGFDGTYCGAFAYNAVSTTTIQALMDTYLGAGNVAVTGPAAGPYVFTFAQEYGYRDLPLLTVDTGSLTGGSATIAETTKGSVGSAGGFVAWDGTRTDGGEVAKGVLWNSAQTNAKGELLTEFGAFSNGITTFAAIAGEFLVSDLTGINDVTAAQLGMFTAGGPSVAASGTNEIQTVTYDAANTGGSLRLTVVKPNGDRVTTAAITWNGTDATYLASIQSALDTATGVVNGIVAGGLPDTALTLTYSGTGYAGKSHGLASVATFPTSSAGANVTRTAVGANTSYVAGTIIKIGVGTGR